MTKQALQIKIYDISNAAYKWTNEDFEKKYGDKRFYEVIADLIPNLVRSFIGEDEDCQELYPGDSVGQQGCIFRNNYRDLLRDRLKTWESEYD